MVQPCELKLVTASPGSKWPASLLRQWNDWQRWNKVWTFPFLIVVLRVGILCLLVDNITKSQACIISHNIGQDLKCLRAISYILLLPCMYYPLGLEWPRTYCVKHKEHQWHFITLSFPGKKNFPRQITKKTTAHLGKMTVPSNFGSVGH